MRPKLVIATAALLGAPASLVVFHALEAATGVQATPICDQVGVTGVVNHSVIAPCVPYPLQTTCDSGSQGLEPTLVVTDYICVPTP